MEIVKVTIEGTSPLLMNNPASMGNGGGDGTPQAKRKYSAETDAEASAYRDEDGTLYLPTTAFRGCLLSAAKGRKFGKTFATTVVKGAVSAATETTPIIHPETGEILRDYVIDTRRAMVGKQGIARSRPKMKAWGAVVEFEYDPDFISTESIESLMTIGGKTIGVGAFRPEKAGPFGRFTVVDVD